MSREPLATDVPIRDAATIVVARPTPQGPAILMGQRGARAAFMPSKFVFPGGAVDPGDAGVPLAAPLSPICVAALEAEAPEAPAPATLAATAIRELREETGLALARPGAWPGPVPKGWAGFAAAALLPDAGALRFVFRAVTPPGRTRRFDARFFLADAGAIAGDPDDFSGAEDELGHLHWVPLDAARALDLPFITEIVLAEIARHLRGEADPAAGVPFFDNRTATPTFRRLRRPG
jgi:8-oxo-dGTP pyrophosphatase MutT (NUDIX family)